MKILIGGGSGFVGRYLTRLLVQSGHAVDWISRSARGKTGPDRITWTDLSQHGLPHNYDAVVNLAGENLMNFTKRWDEGFRASLVASRVETTKQLVRAIKEAKHPPKVFIGSSGVGYYKADPDVEYTEDSPGGDCDFLAQLSRRWEAASEALDDTDVRRVTVRIGVVLGRTGGVIQQMYMPFAFGLGGPLGSGKQWFPWIHLHDITGIIIYAIENPKVTGVLNAVAPQQVTNAEFTQTFARAMNRPAVFWVPGFVLNLVYGVERGKVVLEGQRVSPKRTLEVGYNFQYADMKSACQEFARPYKSDEYQSSS